MADTSAGVVEVLARFRKEFPCVTPRRKRQLDYAVSFEVPNFAVGHGKSQEVVTASAGSDDNLANAVLRIRAPIRVLRSEAFVRMFVPGENQIGVRRIQILPEGLQFRVNRMRFGNAAAE